MNYVIVVKWIALVDEVMGSENVVVLFMCYHNLLLDNKSTVVELSSQSDCNPDGHLDSGLPPATFTHFKHSNRRPKYAI